MVKKIEPLSNWIPCHQAAELLSEKMGFPVESRYIRQLAKRKKKPVRIQSLGYHQLYSKEDILACNVSAKHRTDSPG